MKRVPLRLLPVTSAVYDSLFWLVNLGLIDGAFVGVSSWSDFSSIQPCERETLIFIKPEMREVLVSNSLSFLTSLKSDLALYKSGRRNINFFFIKQIFRFATKRSFRNGPLMSTEQSSSAQMSRLLIKLSHFYKLERPIVSSLLLRSAAYQLSKLVSEEERCTIMGHSTDDNVYWAHYRNETSTVDLQGLRHQLDSQDLSILTSVFLGTESISPPTEISKTRWSQILADTQLLALFDAQETLRVGLVDKFGSMRAVRIADPGADEQWNVARLSYQHRLRVLESHGWKRTAREPSPSAPISTAASFQRALVLFAGA